MEQIKKYFEQRSDLSKSDCEVFSSKLVKNEFSKKHSLIKIGQTENHLSFVEKGIIRFFIPKEENNLTFDFAFENNFGSGYSSFLTQTPSSNQMETLTNVNLW